MTAAQHVETLFANAGGPVCEYVIVNEQPPSRLLETYAEEGQVPVVADFERIERLGVTAVGAQVISETQTVRHDPDRLAAVVFSIIDQAVAERATLVKPAKAYRRPSAAATDRG